MHLWTDKIYPIWKIYFIQAVAAAKDFRTIHWILSDCAFPRFRHRHAPHNRARLYEWKYRNFHNDCQICFGRPTYSKYSDACYFYYFQYNSKFLLLANCWDFCHFIKRLNVYQSAGIKRTLHSIFAEILLLKYHCCTLLALFTLKRFYKQLCFVQ